MKKFVVLLLFFTVALQGFSTPGKKQIRLRLTDSQTSVFDETSVYLDLGSPQFIGPEDGQKVFDTASSAPSLYSFSSDRIPCFSNSYGNFTPAMVIPLGIRVSGAGTFKFKATLLDNFDPTSIIRLEDRTLGVFYDLRMGDYTINLNQAQQDEGRFYIRVSYPALISTIDAGCNNNDGIISVVQDTSIRWNTCNLYDDNFNLIAGYNSVTGNFSYGSLAFGNYNMVFTYGAYTTAKTVQLGGRSVTAAVSASTVYTAVGQPVQFFATCTNTTNYLWDFGEGSQIVGITNPTFSYNQTGVFNASVTCSNTFGCSAKAYITITVSTATSVNPISADNISVTSERKNLRIIFSKTPESNYNLQLFNLIGQQVVSNSLESEENIIDLSSLNSGVYIARISDGHTVFSKKIILP